MSLFEKNILISPVVWKPRADFTYEGVGMLVKKVELNPKGDQYGLCPVIFLPLTINKTHEIYMYVTLVATCGLHTMSHSVQQLDKA